MRAGRCAAASHIKVEAQGEEKRENLELGGAKRLPIGFTNTDATFHR